VLLFKKAFHEGLSSGAITLTFRRWQKPHVKPGGRYRCHPIGVLEVDDVALVHVREITARDASLAGFASRDALIDYLRELGPLDDDTEIYRVGLHHGGDGDRVQLALEAHLSPEDVETIREKLARLDRGGAWTAQTFALIEKHPQIAASKLAAKVGRETAPFKIDVRKLKKLGLTQSFEVGYEISPRGRAYLDANKKKKNKNKKKAAR
jgi:ASCH domain-containing protein